VLCFIRFFLYLPRQMLTAFFALALYWLDGGDVRLNSSGRYETPSYRQFNLPITIIYLMPDRVYA